MSKEEPLLKVKEEIGGTIKSIKDLRKELKEFKDQMANLEEGSDAFLEVANKAGEVKHQIDEINESIKGASADFGDIVGNVTNVAAGITGAFQAVAGGLQAIGIESEALDKTIAKMQGLMAVTQGLGSIDTAIKSLDKLRNSITSTTGAAKLLKAALQPKAFLAITAVITGLSLVFGKLGKNAKEVAERERERAEAYKQMKLEEQKRKQEEYNTALERELLLKEKIIGVKFNGEDTRIETELIKLYTQEISELDAQLKNRYKDNEKLALKKQIRELENDLKGLDEGSQQYIETLIEIAAAEDKIKKLKPLSYSDIADIEKRIADLQGKIKDAEFRLKEAQALQKATDEAAAEAAAERERIAQQRKSTNIKHDNQIIPLQIEPLPPATELLEEMGVKIGNIVANSTNKAINEKWKENIENVEKTGNEIFDELKNSFELYADSSLGLTSGWIESLNQFQTVFNMTMDTVEKKGKATWQDYGNIVTNALSGVGSILNTLSQEQDASTEEGFKKTKQFQIAATIMNMLSGIMNAWTSAMSPSNAWMTVAGQIAMGTAMSGMIAGIGAAQIEKIKNATMSSANPNTNINAKSVNSMIIPPVQYSNAVQGANTVGAITNQKVYVLESDITNTTKAVVTQSEENTY